LGSKKKEALQFNDIGTINRYLEKSRELIGSIIPGYCKLYAFEVEALLLTCTS